MEKIKSSERETSYFGSSDEKRGFPSGMIGTGFLKEAASRLASEI